MMFFIKPAGQKYVDRGDPDAYDFDVGDFITDGQWRELDLSSILPLNAKAVDIKVRVGCPTRIVHISFRKKGNSGYHNSFTVSTQVTTLGMYGAGIIDCSNDRIIEYSTINVSYSILSFVVKGWWE